MAALCPGVEVQDLGLVTPRAGSRVVSIDPLGFLARCRKRQPNMSTFVLRILFHCVVAY